MSDCKSCDGELAKAEKADTKLADANDSTTELADGNDAARHDRRSVRPIFERDMQQRKAKQFCFGFVFISPAIPSVSGRIGRTTLRAGEGLLRYFMSAFTARLHVTLSWLNVHIDTSGRGGNRRGRHQL